MDNTNAYKPNTNLYKYSIDMKYVLDDEVKDIDNMNIRSVAVDCDYKNTNMPMIFVTAAIDKNLIDKMVENQDTGFIILNIRKAISNSGMSDLYTDYISDKFIYFISNDINKASEIDYTDQNSDREDLFKIVSLGLLSAECVNNNKKIANGVISGKQSSILYYILSHMPCLIEPPTDNKYISNQFLPPINSVAKMIEYLNSLKVIYSTQYRFFMDFDCAYLLSSTGRALKKKNEDITSVYLTIRNAFDESSKIQGMTIDKDNGFYQIECDGADCELADNHVSDKTFNKISATDSSGNKSDKELINRSDKSIISKKTRAVRVQNDNTGLLDNMVSSSDTQAVQLLVQKTNIDSSVLTLNKEYNIKADEVYKSDKYNGKYILSRKRELYMREDENFVMNVMLLMEKVPGEYSSPKRAKAKAKDLSLED